MASEQESSITLVRQSGPIEDGLLNSVALLLNNSSIKIDLDNDIHWVKDQEVCRISTQKALSKDALNALKNLLSKAKTDLFYHEDKIEKPKLLITGLQNILIDGFIVDMIAGELKIKRRVGEITRRALTGTLDSNAATKEQMMLLRGASAEILDDILDNIEFKPKAIETIKSFQNKNIDVVLITTAPSYFVRPLAKKLGVMFYHCNSVEFENKKLTGTMLPPILGRDEKITAVKEHMTRMQASPAQTAALCHSAIDESIVNLVGNALIIDDDELHMMGINHLQHSDMDAALYALGAIR